MSFNTLVREIAHGGSWQERERIEKIVPQLMIANELRNQADAMHRQAQALERANDIAYLAQLEKMFEQVKLLEEGQKLLNQINEGLALSYQNPKVKS